MSDTAIADTQEVLADVPAIAKKRTTRGVSKVSEVMQKRKRIPISDQRDQLGVAGLPEGFKFRWVADVPGRINKFLTAGYSFVQNDGNRIVGEEGINWRKPKFSLVTRGGGKGVELFLMGIPLEFYTEDMAAKELKIKEMEASIYRRVNEAGGGNFYGKVQKAVKSTPE